MKEEKEGDSLEVLHQCKTTSLANSMEQGSTLRDLLTTTAGKLKLGSTDAGIAFAPVYSTASQVRLPQTCCTWTWTWTPSDPWSSVQVLTLTTVLLLFDGFVHQRCSAVVPVVRHHWALWFPSVHLPP